MKYVRLRDSVGSFLLVRPESWRERLALLWQGYNAHELGNGAHCLIRTFRISDRSNPKLRVYRWIKGRRGWLR
jgi:hypothetical protein